MILYRSCLRQGSALGEGGEEDLKAGGGEGQVAGYFLLSCVPKNMKHRTNCSSIVQIHEHVLNV